MPSYIGVTFAVGSGLPHISPASPSPIVISMPLHIYFRGAEGERKPQLFCIWRGTKSAAQHPKRRSRNRRRLRGGVSQISLAPQPSSLPPCPCALPPVGQVHPSPLHRKPHPPPRTLRSIASCGAQLPGLQRRRPAASRGNGAGRRAAPSLLGGGGA